MLAVRFLLVMKRALVLKTSSLMAFLSVSSDIMIDHLEQIAVADATVADVAVVTHTSAAATVSIDECRTK